MQPSCPLPSRQKTIFATNGRFWLQYQCEVIWANPTLPKKHDSQMNVSFFPDNFLIPLIFVFEMFFFPIKKSFRIHPKKRKKPPRLRKKPMKGATRLALHTSAMLHVLFLFFVLVDLSVYGTLLMMLGWMILIF